MRIAWQVGWLLLVAMVPAAVAAAPAAPAAANAKAGADDPFYRGLEQRGLRSLMEAYLKQQSAEATAEPGTQAPAAGGNKLALAALAVGNALKAQNMGDRDTAFKNARQLYEGAIADAGKAMTAIPADRIGDRNKALLDQVNLRLTLANMVFQQWLKTDLDLLEVTDRRGGDRTHATALLKIASDQYKAVLQDTQTWLSVLDQLPAEDRRKIVNSGQVRRVRNIQRDAEFSGAWVTYYYGWCLPKDFKPTQGGRQRDEILEDAITAFQPYTQMPDRVSAKWYAHMVIGMTYREVGKFDQALQSMALASSTNVPESVAESLKIRVAYERALTLIRKGDFAKARDAIKESRDTWKEKLEGQVYGLALPMLEAESLILEGKAAGDQTKKDAGVEILKEVHKRPNPWPVLVQAVMKSLVGDQPVGELSPFQMWIEANDALAEANQLGQDKNDPKKIEAAAKRLKQAEDLFKAYAAKVGTKDPKYSAALYSQAACLLQLLRKAEAADLFRKVAEEDPKYKYASAAARYAVSVHGELYESQQTEDNRAAYEDALRWFIAKWLDSDPDQQYYFALILYRGKKFIDAADAFGRVADKAEHYPDSRFWVALCRLEHFRERILASQDKQLILTGARNVVQALLEYTKYAFAAQDGALPDDRKKLLLDWAEASYLNAADVYLYPEVSLPADALPILDEMDKKFTLNEDMRGRSLKLRITALQQLGRLDEAQQTLTEFLRVAKPADVGPVLRGLFRAMTDDVRELIKRQQQKLAAVKVEQAKVIGDRFLEWLEKSTIADKALQIENSRYDLAELYLAVGNYSGALAIYQEIGGMKPWVVKKGEALKEDCVYGIARAFQGMGDASTDPAQAKPHFETAQEAWRALLAIPITDPQDRWEREYNLYYCKFKLGDKKEVADALKAIEIMRPPLGGKDPLLQKKFRDLMSQASSAGR